jgi:hypothetical protein
MTPHEQFEEPFAEPPADEITQDDVVDKVDQLLGRHRPKPPDDQDVPVLAEADAESEASADDGIPTLTDVVSTSYVAINRRAVASPATIDDAVILDRLEVTLETVRVRLESQIGANVDQARLLDQLVAVLKLALPDAVRSTGQDPVAESTRSDASPQL